MEEITIIKSEYVTSAVSKKTCPEEILPEIVFLGRSNVGKSSLINSLVRRRNLARTSGTPGKTQTINFFRVELKTLDDTRREFYLVDLPGYGYAKTSKSNRKLWAKFIDEYLSNRRDIKFVCQLIDMRHPPKICPYSSSPPNQISSAKPNVKNISTRLKILWASTPNQSCLTLR